MPAWWLSQNSLRNGGSVASSCVTRNCMGVSLRLSSSIDGFWYVRFDMTVTVPLCVGFAPPPWLEGAIAVPLSPAGLREQPNDRASVRIVTMVTTRRSDIGDFL